MYAETRNMTFYGNDSFGGIANKTQNFEVVAQYQFDDFNYRCVRPWPICVEG